MQKNNQKIHWGLIRLIKITGYIAIFLWLVVLATPNFGGHGRRDSNKRACFANQKTIAGAIEMYDLDYKCNFLEKSGGQLTKTSYKTLSNGGYLQTIPSHPGSGEKPSIALRFTKDGKIFCLTHGFVHRNSDFVFSHQSSPHEQLKAYGETTPELLDLASKDSTVTGIMEKGRDKLTKTYTFFFGTGFIALLFWFPLNILHLNKWRKAQMIKFALFCIAVTTIIMTFIFGNSFFLHSLFYFHGLSLPIFIMIPLILLILLCIDLLIYNIQLLFATDPVKYLNDEKSLWLSISEQKINQIKKLSDNISSHYLKSLKILKYALYLTTLAVGGWLMSKYSTMNNLWLVLATITGWTISGLVTGVSSYIFILNSVIDNPNKDSSHDVISNESSLALIVAFSSLIVIGIISINSSNYVSASYVVLSLIILSSFYGGRFLAIFTLSRKFSNAISHISDKKNKEKIAMGNKSKLKKQSPLA